ncbi:TonB-dependent receptor [Simiduia sp. 21SJ11W-1]|uniref:TonB-dependent receptor domain-containing protein n=1 Tax=Simiduia sp. 21SJ11W-1 TaxID=2909669 RepID=UPI00209CD074|nr:TonB-dependent receptor [Simiduia sp. 21SJ11W-1]UTA48792.1 TonB-dependent receptor [Simiduia sp. 21SJ11W-1]
MVKRTKLATAIKLAALGVTSSAMLLGGNAYAQDQGLEALEEVVVTGSRIQKANLVTSSPVTQLDSEQLVLTGSTKMEDVMRSMPQVTLDQDSGQAIESNGTATLQLRNLGSSRTLVLLDGKRLPISSPSSSESGPDINFIPMALLERVEVLTGGASSTYGSDAVAGVVNFIMQKDFEGVKVDLQTSRNRHSNDSGHPVAEAAERRGFDYATGSGFDGDITDFTFMVGGNFDNGKGNLTAYATKRDVQGVTQSQRESSACAVRSEGGNCLGSGTKEEGTFYFENDGFDQAWQTEGDQFIQDNGSRYNFAPPSYSQRPDDRITMGVLGHYELNENAELYTQLMFMDNRSITQFGPAGMFFDSGVSIPCSNPLLSAQQYATMGCTDPSDRVAVYLGRRAVEIGPRFGDLRHTTYRGVFGVQGDINNAWRYDLSYQYSEVDMRNRNGNYFDIGKAKRGLDVTTDTDGNPVCASVVDGSDSNCVPWNVFETGGVTQEQVDYLSQQYFERGTTDQEIFSGYVQGSLGEYGIKLPTAENGIEVVFGLEHRMESLQYFPDDAAMANLVGGLSAALVPVDGDFSVDEFFMEASIPLLEGKSFAEEVTLDLGYRFADYDSGKSTDTYKIAGSWAINDQVKLRGSYQRAVRMPNIVDQFQPQQGSLFGMDDDPCGGVDQVTGLSQRGYTFAECARSGVTQAVWDNGGPSDSPAAQYNTLIGGNPDLDPEVSDTQSFGILLSPNFIEGLTISADWYDIDVQDAITFVGQETTLLECIENDAFCDKVKRNPVGDSLWLGNSGPDNGIQALSDNIGFFRVTGVDLEINYDLDLDSMGSIVFANTLGYISKWEQEEYVGAGVLECQGKYAGSCGVPTPDMKNRFTATWLTPWDVTANLTWRHIGAIDSLATTPVDIKAFNWFDLSATWAVNDWASVRGGINNILDETPPFVPQGITARENGNTYPGLYDHLGQYWFVGATLKF